MAVDGASSAIRSFLESGSIYSVSLTAGTVGRMTLSIPTLDLATDTLDNEAILYDSSPTPAPPYAFLPSHCLNYIGDFWFDLIHVLPRRIDLGNILTTVEQELDVYNAFLYLPKDLETVVNNAGDGTSIPNLPGLPVTIPAQRSQTMTFEVTPDGQPVIDSSIVFGTEESYDISVPVTGTRIVMFPYEPESPMTERLKFLTNVMESIDGSEQRVSIRLAPRQEFDFIIMREDGIERQRYELLMFDWQARVFGTPVWTEPSTTTGAITASDTIINVDDTSLSDYRVNGLAIVYESETKWDALEVSTVGATSITFKSPILNSYAVGTRVMPVRTSIVSGAIQEKRYPVNLSSFAMTMRVLDNEVDLSDTSGWPTYNGKILLSDPNVIAESMNASLILNTVVFDSAGAGKFSQTTSWSRGKRASGKAFITRSRTALFALRKLLHAFRGQQVSFYLPTFSNDILLADTYVSGTPSFLIYNVGYSQYARQRTPKLDMRIILNDGTVFTRTITASAVVDADTEQVTLSTTIGQNIEPGDVHRIEFIEPVRITNEDITIQHADDNGTARVSFPVISVVE